MTRAGTLLAGVLLATSVLQGWDRAAGGPGIDFYQFWAVGRFAPRAPHPYADATRAEIAASFRQAAPAGSRLAVASEYRAVLDTYASPFLYALFGFAATGDYDADYLAFQRVSIAAYALGTFLLARTAGLAILESLLLGAVLVACSGPFDSDVRVGNVGRFQVGLLGISAWLLARPAPGARLAAGALLGAGIAFKPTLGLAVVLLLLSRRFRGGPVHELGAGLALGGLVAVAVGAGAFGSPQVWGDWVRAVTALPAEAIAPRLGNLGLVPLLAPVAGSRIPSVLITLGGGTLAAVLLGRTRPPSDLPALALGAVVTLLGAPLAWIHYYVLAVPALAVAFAGPRGARLLGTGALVLFASPPVLAARLDPRGWCVVMAVATVALGAAVALALAGGTEEKPAAI